MAEIDMNVSEMRRIYYFCRICRTCRGCNVCSRFAHLAGQDDRLVFLSEVSAELPSIVPGRQVDDNAHIMLRFNNGTKGMMWASMVAAGHLHRQRIRVYGKKGSLEWVQEQPNELVLRPVDGPHQILSRDSGSLSNSGFSPYWRYHNDTHNRYRCDWAGLDGRSAQPLVSRHSRSFS